MINFFNLFPGFLQKARSVFSLRRLNPTPEFNDYSNDMKKLQMVLTNPAALKVFKLQCDVFSLGKVTVEQNGETLENDPFIQLIENPNPLQSKSQLLWDFMFWNMIGTAYCYVDSRVVEKKGNKLYMLMNPKIEFPHELEKWKDKLIFSDDTLAKLYKTMITYRYDDGSTFQFPLDRLIISTDLTGGMGNWFKGPSSLDALVKVITNSEAALDAKNINVRYTGKFMVGSSNQLNTVGLGDNEKKDIEEKMDSDKTVWPVKTMVQIRRFVDDMGSLKLDEVFMADYYTIGSLYNIPRDVLEAYNQSSTYENQEKATMRHVTYTMSPKGNEWLNQFERHFGYREAGKNIKISWDHLSFAQVFEKEKADKNKIVAETLSSLLKEGVTLEQANKFLGTEFVIPPPDQVIDDNSSPETLAAQAALRGSVGGVQGILAVQQGVSAGTTTYDAAISILMIIYGFTDQQARSLLGQPNEAQGAATQAGQGQAGASQ